MQKDSPNGDNSATDDDDELTTIPRQSKPRFSAFAALADDDGDDNGEDDEELEPNREEENPSSAAEKLDVEEPTAANKSKKPKKKKRRKGKKPETPGESEKAAKGKSDGLDEIDRAIKELNLAPIRGPSDTATGSQNVVKASERLSQLLRINLQHLKVLNEMRRLFGKEAIEAAQADEEAQIMEHFREIQRRGARGEGVDLETFLRAPMREGLSEVVARRNPFIEGKKRWPKGSAGGLTMTTIGNMNEETTEFSFAQDKAYSGLDSTFFFLIGMHDPTRLIHFLQQHPYHVSTLIQVSKVAIQDQNASLAAELCERALFTFGRVTLSTFRKKLEEGRARLNFNRPENRQFWLAGWNYIKNLIRKGTFRTALEWTKLFVSISPEDPYALINWLHVLAIRAHEAQWFVDLCDSDLLSQTSPKIDTAPYIRQTLVLARLQRGDRATARTLLTQGMAQLPWLYSSLFKALSLDVPKSLWAIFPRDDDEQLHTELYIHLTKDLWNKPDIAALLVEVAKAIPRPDFESLPPGPKVSLGAARFVYLDNTPELMAHVPRGMLHVAPNFDFDPLPPPKEQNIFSHESQRMPWESDPTEQLRARNGPQGHLPADIAAMAEEMVNNPELGEDDRGYLQRFLDMLGAAGVLMPRPGDLGGAMAGEWEEEDDEEDEDGMEEGEAAEWEDHYDFEGDLDDVEDWGYGHGGHSDLDEGNDPDGDDDDDQMPALEPIDGGNRAPGAWPE
jgi:hypothetical protein